MDLPAELRERIYKMTLRLPASGVQVIPPENGYQTRMRVFTRNHESQNTVDLALTDRRRRNTLTTFTIRAFLGLLLTCRKIYEEAMSLFYKDNNFVFFGLFALSRGLRALAPTRRNHIEHVSLNWCADLYYSSGDGENALKILSQMPYLRRLDVQVSESDWTSYFSKIDNKPFTVTRIPGFTAMQKIRGLKTVKFYGDCDGVKSVLEPLLMQPLAETAEKKRKAAMEPKQEATKVGRKRKVEVEVHEAVDVDAPSKTRSMARGLNAKGA